MRAIVKGWTSSDINSTYFPITCATQNIHNKISLHRVRFNIIELGLDMHGVSDLA